MEANVNNNFSAKLMPAMAMRVIYETWPSFKEAVRAFKERVNRCQPFTRKDAEAMEAVMQMTEGKRNRETYAHYILDLAYAEYMRRNEHFAMTSLIARSKEIWLMANNRWMPVEELNMMYAN